MLSLTRRLLALRRASPALSVGRYRPLDGADVPDDCFVFLREADSERLLVALNFAGGGAAATAARRRLRDDGVDPPGPRGAGRQPVTADSGPPRGA